jgi:hypothetical protein
MGIITEEIFTNAIETLRLQFQYDIQQAQALSIALKVVEDNIPTYDNSRLVKSIISLLQIHFPKQDGFCMIEHYCFNMNFGKVGDKELITIENLWFEVNKNQK